MRRPERPGVEAGRRRSKRRKRHARPNDDEAGGGALDDVECACALGPGRRALRESLQLPSRRDNADIRPAWSDLRQAARGGKSLTPVKWIPQCSFIERIERIDEEIKALNEGKKEVLTEAKGEGFDVKVLREILRLRNQDKDERDEQESLLDLYLRAMESAGASQVRAA